MVSSEAVGELGCSPTVRMSSWFIATVRMKRGKQPRDSRNQTWDAENRQSSWELQSRITLLLNLINKKELYLRSHTTALTTFPQLAHRKAKKKRKKEKKGSKIDSSSSEEDEGLKEAAVSAEMFR